jgi:hypothetical protein
MQLLLQIVVTFGDGFRLAREASHIAGHFLECLQVPAMSDHTGQRCENGYPLRLA